MVAGLSVGLLLAQRRQSGTPGYAAVPFALAAVAAFTYSTNWLGLGAPMWAKVVFTTSLQIVGSFAAVGAVLWLGYVLWLDRRPN